MGFARDGFADVEHERSESRDAGRNDDDVGFDSTRNSFSKRNEGGKMSESEGSHWTQITRSTVPSGTPLAISFSYPPTFHQRQDLQVKSLRSDNWYSLVVFTMAQMAALQFGKREMSARLRGSRSIYSAVMPMSRQRPILVFHFI